MSRSDDNDLACAEVLAEEFSASSVEADALLRYAMARTSSIAQTERFLTIAGLLAVALEEYGELEGTHLRSLCQRGEVLFEKKDRSTTREAR